MLSVKPWRTEAVFFLVAAQVFFVLLGGLAMGLLHKVGVAGFKGDNDFGIILIGTLSFQGTTWVLMVLFFRLNSVSLSEGLGLANKNLLRSLLLAFGVTAFILPVALVLQYVSVTLMEKVGWTPQNEAAVALLTGASSRATQIYLGFFAVVLAPVAEEFLFRGLLFPFIKQLGYRKSAWIGVNLLFSLIHGDAGIFLPLFVLALALTWLYETTDTLLAPIFGHALFNAANLVLLKFLPQ
jgi:membrane protease YdiL (CAAX protease family)